MDTFNYSWGQIFMGLKGLCYPPTSPFLKNVMLISILSYPTSYMGKKFLILPKYKLFLINDKKNELKGIWLN